MCIPSSFLTPYKMRVFCKIDLMFGVKDEGLVFTAFGYDGYDWSEVDDCACGVVLVLPTST